ncbi:MAG TPA: hypothetical protein VEA69_01840 [Tepidisphaeraceae bacterium]|nr:hypothetical protein [Tepidisphaeraceae bacterium]
MIQRALMSVMITAVVLMGGCDKGTSGPADPRAKAGRVVGTLADARGGPLSNVTVRVRGFTRGGDAVDKTFEVKGPAKGYEFELPDGTYSTPEAVVTAEYHNRTLVFPLAPADGATEWLEARDAKAGLVRDFVWRISGARPAGVGNPLDPTGYWGSAVVFDLGGDFGDTANFEVTLKPDGPLVDGSEGGPLTFVRRIPWRRHEDHFLLDIPTGRYTATAKLLYGNRPKALKLISYTIDPANPDAAPTSSALSATVEFETRKDKSGRDVQATPSIVVFP